MSRETEGEGGIPYVKGRSRGRKGGSGKNTSCESKTSIPSVTANSLPSPPLTWSDKDEGWISGLKRQTDAAKEEWETFYRGRVKEGAVP